MTTAGATSVTDVLDAHGVAYVAHTHPPIRTEADLGLTGLDWSTSVKTLAFELPDGRVALVGVPGPARIQYGEVARALGVPRSALRPAGEDRLAAIGMEPGGVSPVCSDPAAVVLLDPSVLALGTVYCGGGTGTLTVEVDSAALLRIAAAPMTASVVR